MRQLLAGRIKKRSCLFAGLHQAMFVQQISLQVPDHESAWGLAAACMHAASVASGVTIPSHDLESASRADRWRAWACTWACRRSSARWSGTGADRTRTTPTASTARSCGATRSSAWSSCTRPTSSPVRVVRVAAAHAPPCRWGWPAEAPFTVLSLCRVVVAYILTMKPKGGAAGVTARTPYDFA